MSFPKVSVGISKRKETKPLSLEKLTLGEKSINNNTNNDNIVDDDDKTLFFSLSTTLDSGLRRRVFRWSRDCVLFLCFLRSLFSRCTLSLPNIFLLRSAGRAPERCSNSAPHCFLLPSHSRLWAFYATVFRLLRLFYNYTATRTGKRQREQNG